MKSVVGVFESVNAARNAANMLWEAGIDPKDVTVLAPTSPESAWEHVPQSGTEQPGMGGAVGGLVGGAVGAAVGAPVGAALASLLVPGVGPIVAIGIAGAAVLGAGGVAAGVATGHAIENRLFTGLPEDEVFFYEDALRRGRSVVVAFAPDDDEARAARALLEEGGAESLDAARESWWLGIRSAEKEHYETHARGNFHHDELSYRHGFEAALRPGMRGKSYDEAAESLRRHYPEAGETCFRLGYERGQAHFNNVTKS
jgi:hypothetical protein